MSPAPRANGLRPTMSRVAVGLPCPGLTAMKALPLFLPQSQHPGLVRTVTFTHMPMADAA